MRDPGTTNKSAIKSAEILSSTGALALGIGLGAYFPDYVGRTALPLLVAGIVSHGAGMLWKHRLEAEENYVAGRWVQLLYWGCWAVLTVLLLLIGIKAIMGQMGSR
jgi:hypothetical protein